MNAVTSLGFSAWSSIMVLFAQDLLGLGSVGFGLLWTGSPPARCSGAS
jgi:hypothetical protein